MIVKQNRLILPLLVMLLVAWLSVGVSAAEALDTTRDCELIIEYTHDGEPIAGAPYALYRVADVSADGEITVCDPFSAYPLDFSDLTGENFRAMAQTLDAFVKMDQLVPDHGGYISQYGFGEVTGLKPGIYLLLGQRYIGPEGLYVSTPTLISLPTRLSADGEWFYNVTVLPKCTFTPHEGMGTTSKKVLKVWNDPGNEATRPESIEVILLCNGVPYASVELNAENGWSYVWNDLPAGEEWLVVEVVPDGYKVLLMDENLVTKIVNTNDNPPPPTEPGGGELSPTGMLWWPMPLLIIAGVVLIAVGLRLNRRETYEA